MRAKRKGKLLLIALALIIGGTAAYARMGMRAPVMQDGAEEDVSEDRDALSFDDQAAEAAKRETILYVPWGEAEEQLQMSVYNGETSVSYETPSSFTVAEDGRIYVYDALSGKIKIYQNNQWQKSISEPLILHDMDVSSDGTIYGISHFESQGIKIEEEGAVCPFPDPDNSGLIRPCAVDVLFSGEIRLLDDNEGDNTTHVRKFNAAGGVVSPEQGVNMYDYEDAKGNTVSLLDTGPGQFQLKILDGQSGKPKGVCHFSAAEADGYYYGVTPLGVDREGYLYLRVSKSPAVSPFDSNECSEYITRIDIDGNTSETISIEYNSSMLPCSANVCGRMIKMDDEGNIYQVILSMEGYTVVKYGF